jgi:hypothetical protein
MTTSTHSTSSTYAAVSSSASPSVAGAAAATDVTPLAGSKRRASVLREEEEDASPIYPDYSIPTSSGDSVASGDDSGQWELEGERVLAAHADRNAEEEAMWDDLPNEFEEVREFELGAVDLNNLPTNDFARHVEYENVAFSFKTTNAGTVKDLAKEMGLQYTGAKKILWERIVKSGHLRIISLADDGQSFTFRRAKEVADPFVSRWVTLTPEVVPEIEGMDMLTGSERGFFGPTNPTNAAGATRSNFCSAFGETISRPEFGPKVPFLGPPPPPSSYENGHPSLEAYEAIGDIKFARPKDFFDLQISPEYISNIRKGTNYRASAEGVGLGETGSEKKDFGDFKPFDDDEMYKFIGLMLANGLTPRSNFASWFCSTPNRPAYDANFAKGVFDKRVQGITISGLRRWRHFRRFLTLSNYRLHPADEQRKNPMWKVQSLIDELNYRARKHWITGKWVAIDEQTIGFKGRSGMKLRISYKREGDGFQCDALCDKGYTFSFFFRHGNAPKIGREYANLSLSDTAKRVIWLADRLPNQWTRVYMDNLFNSQKLFSALYLAKCLGHGVTRAHGRGIPDHIKQAVEMNAKKAEALKGTTTAARLINSTDSPDLLAICVYDNKPVHLLSMVAESVEWIAKKRNVYHRESRKMRMMSYLRLNVIDDYNNNMNNVDIADQLRGHHRPDHWMRHKKWWWAIFMWGIGVARVNAYKIYEAMWDEERAKGRMDLPAKWTAGEFIEQLAYDMMFPAQTLVHRQLLRREEDLDDSSIEGRSLSSFGSLELQPEDEREWDFSCQKGIKDYLKEDPGRKITDGNMKGTAHSHRLNGNFHAMIKALPHMRCQYCYYIWKHDMNAKQQRDFGYMERNRADTMRCLRCNVNLCPNCWNEWHGVDMRDTNRLLGR